MVHQNMLRQQDSTCLTRQQRLHNHGDHQGSSHLLTLKLVIIANKHKEKKVNYRIFFL